MHLKKILTVLSLFFLFHNFHIPKFRIPFHSLPILQAQTQTVEIEEALSGFDESESDPTPEEADLLSGFDEEEPEMEYEQQAPGSSQHPDWRGIRKQRGFLQLKWDHRVFQNARIFIEGKVSGDLLPDTLDKGVYDALPGKNREAYDQYRQSLMENELREAYFQISPLSFMDLKLGRQIMIWGTADSLSVVDVLNPRHEFGRRTHQSRNEIAVHV